MKLPLTESASKLVADAGLNVHLSVLYPEMATPLFFHFLGKSFFCPPVTPGLEVGRIYHTGAGQSVGSALLFRIDCRVEDVGKD